MTVDDAYAQVQRNPNYFCCGGRPRWMTNEQWRQVRAFLEGRALLADPELIKGFQRCTELHDTNSRCAQWIYSTVSSYVVNEPHFTNWCNCIKKYAVDDDLTMDDGL